MRGEALPLCGASVTRLPAAGPAGWLDGSVTLDPSGTVAVTGGFDGVVARPVTGETPHLLSGTGHPLGRCRSPQRALDRLGR